MGDPPEGPTRNYQGVHFGASQGGQQSGGGGGQRGAGPYGGGGGGGAGPSGYYEGDHQAEDHYVSSKSRRPPPSFKEPSESTPYAVWRTQLELWCQTCGLDAVQQASWILEKLSGRAQLIAMSLGTQTILSGTGVWAIVSALDRAFWTEELDQSYDA